MGTVVKPYGVIATPQVVRWSIAEHPNAVLVLACDGIWDYLDNDTVAEVVSDGIEKGTPSQDIARELFQSAREDWKEDCDDYCDDISVLVVPLGGKSLQAIAAGGGGCGEGPCKNGCAIS